MPSFLKERPWRYVILLGGAILISCLSWNAYAHSVDRYLHSLPNASALATLERDMPGILEAQGSARALAIVHGAYDSKQIGVDDCHVVLHLLGHIAYRRYGEDFGQLLAGSDKGFCIDGYIHGIEAQLATEGDTLMLQKFCAYLKEHELIGSSCFHGVGHSEFERTSDARGSLSFCDSLAGGSEPDMTGCYRGVFSEIGNQINGYSGNTGETIPKLVDVSQDISSRHPYVLCESVESRYKDACYTQIAKTFYIPEDETFGVNGCRAASRDASAVSICTRIVAALASRVLLDTGNTARIARLLHETSPGQKRYVVAGIREAYASQVRSGGLPPWVRICLQLPSPEEERLCAQPDLRK